MAILNGTYGSEHTPCNVITLEEGCITWYCVEGSVNVNATYDSFCDCIDVETISDINTCTASDPIETEEELRALIHDDGEEEKIQTLTININNFNNQSMVDDHNGEVIRILKGIISNIGEYGLLNGDGMRLRDINGNSIGTMDIEVY